MNDVSKGKNDSKEEKKGIMMSMRVMRINISDFQKKKKDANDCRFEARNHWMPPIAACIFFFFFFANFFSESQRFAVRKEDWHPLIIFYGSVKYRWKASALGSRPKKSLRSSIGSFVAPGTRTFSQYSRPSFPSRARVRSREHTSVFCVNRV